MKKNTPFHVVSPSPWPLMMSLQVFNTFFGLTKMFQEKTGMYLTIFNILFILLTANLWWRDITRESTLEMTHTKEVTYGIKIGMLLFITSEVFLFISFFWAFFHLSLSSDICLGSNWPSKGMSSMDPLGTPLYNTILLLSSGATLTVSHHYLMNEKKKVESNLKNAKFFMFITIILGMIFVWCQYIEYTHSSFTFSDSSYGSCFYLATGFHGIHVIWGLMALMMSFLRFFKQNINSTHNFGLESAIWYWHFVDTVWLFLFITIYWFGE